MDYIEFSKKLQKRFPGIAREISNIIIKEEDVDNQIWRLQALVMLVISNERLQASKKIQRIDMAAKK